MLIAPVPPRLADAKLVAGFRLIPWDLGASLHPVRPGATPSGSHPPADAASGTAILLAAIAHASRVEPPQLRALRLALAELGTDIGTEYEVWSHPGVQSNLLACTLASAHRAAAETDFRQRIPWRLQRRISELRHRYNLHQSPLIQAEEAIAAGPLAPPEALRQAQELAYRLAATLSRGGVAIVPELVGYLAHLGVRRPELLARHAQLGTAWVIAQRDALRAGTQHQIPAGLELETLAWVFQQGLSKPVFLAQIGATLGVFTHDQSQPVCRLAELAAGADYWQVETSAAPELVDDRARTMRDETVRVLSLDERLALDPTSRYRLTIGRHQLDLESVRRPSWAAGLGRDVAGLFAELPDGRRLYWMARQRLLVGEGADIGLDLPHGAWWDADDYRAWLDDGRRLTRPDWAVRDGIDQSGWWAEIAPKGVIQRMRWIPRGEFLMGSPADEPERFGDGEWAETQHPVVSSRAFWLADTACTQALWEAVLGENPSQFEGAERPVEQVSWTDVVERFLIALNELVPGLEAGLPTEAQWEYACRAGTATAFSFGPNISTDQVNYDSNYPYAGGPQGEYRRQTVEVKALPANDWGLYQMHGNVWEWCADWLGDYPAEAIVDPKGSSEGRERVLRGGGWTSDGGFCRSARRIASGPGGRNGDFGFRLSRGPSPRLAGSAGMAGVAAGGGAPAASPATPARARTKR